MIDALTAALPILLILVLMLFARWSAARAGLAGLALALALAWFVFGYGRSRYGEIGVIGASGGAMVEAVFTAATILWIIIPALCIHHLQLGTGAIAILRRALGRLSADPRITVLLVAWVFDQLIEGAAGLGTNIAMAAQVLGRDGMKPYDGVA
ncbi:MAG: L-lactate permease, partial [Candidatus Competibacteraceae bacterium]|nr:L-lactate permease [Candidatus Competibacteraceae bacterium]